MVLIYILASIIVVCGLVGTVLPLMPGVPVIFLGLFLAAAVSKFSFISTATIVILFVLAAISVLVDYLSGFLGAKYAGSSLFGLLGAIIGVIFGVSVFGLIGVLIGPAIGVFVFDLLSRREIKKSSKVATYTFFSTVAGIITNVVLAVLMIGIFVGAIFI